ncbi:glycosyl hydrolase [Chitinophaga tropicalis]|uniref:Glycoside hydrolase n=1 Tax=Chitinophaga tropicalis TaxID=2683588 RepID=A0A7K1UCW1_9BACT|nr:glycosyl hydrolase [Chitinophaga tropicalis]MVT12217.1 glycoside hydrolase [Chitinophaga tropicalis]
MIPVFRRTARLLIALALTIPVLHTKGQDRAWPVVKKEMRPWTRWWWMGSAVNEQQLTDALTTYRTAGFGGVEIAPIYGAIGYEKQYVPYLSSRWIQLLRHTVTEAGKLDMGVDLTTGTGWPFGGPQVSAPFAASKLVVKEYHAPFTEKIRVKEGKQPAAVLQSLTAYNGSQVLQLKDKVAPDGTLNWTPPPGNWTLYALFNGKTRQMVKRAAPGGEGFTLDHLSIEALHTYLDRFDAAFGKKAPGTRAFYNDSYEVYGADWTESLPAAFAKNRGYDLSRYAREFTGNDNSDTVARLKSDYRETMSELLLNNFTRPWTDWAHHYGGVSKNQAHGSPGNLLDLYAAVDIPECETFGSTYFPIPGLRRDSADVRNVEPDPVMLKFASSAAHVAGHPLVSCETFTWLTEHFKTSLSQCKPEVEQCFLAGVNHVFYHGTTFSPPEVPWPGWLFYASVNFVPSNSFWPHLPGLNNYITRVQSVLQSGLPDNELLIYWPVYDVWNTPKGRDMPLKVHDIDEWLHPTPFYKQVTGLQKVGYSLDFVSDDLLSKAIVAGGKISTNSKAAPYKILVVPSAEIMPVATLEQILQLARQGATVLFQSLPKDVPGLGQLDVRRKKLKSLLASLHFTGTGIREMKLGKGKLLLSEDVSAALQQTGIQREKLTDSGLKFIRRKDEKDTYYYLVNHTPQTIDEETKLNEINKTVILLDPQTGLAGKGTTGKDNNVRVQLQPGEAVILKCTANAVDLPDWKYLRNTQIGDSIEINKWQLQFSNGGPFIPAPVQLASLASWTSLQDTAAQSFSGTGVYTASFELPVQKVSEYVLDLGIVHESARVWINGQDAGILWSIPFRLRIGKWLRLGENTIRIEVANLMANRIRYMDQHKIPWRRYHEINFVNINYKDFDASGWKVQPSGLEGPVRIIPYN